MRGEGGGIEAGGEQFVGQVARFQAAQPHPPEALDPSDADHELGEGGGSALRPTPADRRPPPERPEEHPAQDDLFVSGCQEVTALGLDEVRVLGPDVRAGVGDDTVRAEGVAAVLNLHKCSPVVLESVDLFQERQMANILLDCAVAARSHRGRIGYGSTRGEATSSHRFVIPAVACFPL